ncbi:MAG: thermonuclease family protein, partial [Candidatus Rokuibacteriota bacterium]
MPRAAGRLVVFARRLLPFAVCGLLTLAATSGWAQLPGRPRSLPGAVVKVVSGDTIHVFVNGQVERVRYIGVAAPDPGDAAPDSGEPLGREALAFNRALTNAKNVRIELDVQERDAEGRMLAYVWLGDVMVNAEIIGHGFGQVVTGGPNVRHQETLLRRQERARASKLGIWRTGGPARPKAAQARPGVAPKTRWRCPSSHPIKGDFNTYSAERCIYYVPGSTAYLESRSGRCYATEDEARE